MVLAIYPNSRGYAFAAFESPLAPFDWGVKEVRGASRNKRCLNAMQLMLDRLTPGVIVLQDTSAQGTKRAARIKNLNLNIAKRAAERNIPVVAYSRVHMRQTFGDPAMTKESIARAIVEHVPAFERYLPPARKPWMSEDARMGLFDAAALAITFFQYGAQSGDGKAG